MIEIGEANKAGWQPVVINGCIGRVRGTREGFEYENAQGRVGGRKRLRRDAIDALITLLSSDTKRQGRPIANRYKVQQKVWKKWHPEAQKLFNTMMDSVDQNVVLPVQVPPVEKKAWDVLRWNVAWTAAHELTSQLLRTQPEKP